MGFTLLLNNSTLRGRKRYETSSKHLPYFSVNLWAWLNFGCFSFQIIQKAGFNAWTIIFSKTERNSNETHSFGPNPWDLNCWNMKSGLTWSLCALSSATVQTFGVETKSMSFFWLIFLKSLLPWSFRVSPQCRIYPGYQLQWRVYPVSLFLGIPLCLVSPPKTLRMSSISFRKPRNRHWPASST